jgi:hypothetical protein
MAARQLVDRFLSYSPQSDVERRGMFIWSSIFLFSLFSIFAYYNRRWAREFRGASKAARTFLSLMGFAGTAVGVGYLVWYGVTISWIGSLVAFAASALCVSLVSSLERFLGPILLRIGSVVLWPVLAVLMLWTLVQ